MSYLDSLNKVFDNEISALARTRERLAGHFDALVERVLGCRGKVIVTGIGKSGIIGHKIAATLASTGTKAVFLNAGEALHGDLGIVDAEDIVLMLSKSAATPELANMMPSIRKIGAECIGLFGRSDTRLARDVDLCVDASIEEEACPMNTAPTTSATVALVIGDALAVALMKARGFTREDFAVYHPGGDLGRRLLYRVRDVMQSGGTLPCVPPQVTLEDAIRALSVHSLGAIAVCDEASRLLGILTEGDVRRLFLKRTDLSIPVSEVMTSDPISVGFNEQLKQALDLMESGKRRVYVLPVLDGDKFVGILRMHDIVSV